MSEGIIIMAGMAIFASISGYYAFMVWFKFDEFREKIINRNIEYDLKLPFANISKRWMRTKSYVWYIRIFLLIGFIISFSIFLIGAFGYALG